MTPASCLVEVLTATLLVTIYIYKYNFVSTLQCCRVQ